jgi:hypothetical protein
LEAVGLAGHLKIMAAQLQEKIQFFLRLPRMGGVAQEIVLAALD